MITFRNWTATHRKVFLFIFVEILYIALVLNTIRIFMLCSYTEPGIIPKIRSSKIDYNKTHYVRY